MRGTASRRTLVRGELSVRQQTDRAVPPRRRVVVVDAQRPRARQRVHKRRHGQREEGLAQRLCVPQPALGDSAVTRPSHTCRRTVRYDVLDEGRSQRRRVRREVQHLRRTHRPQARAVETPLPLSRRWVHRLHTPARRTVARPARQDARPWCVRSSPPASYQRQQRRSHHTHHVRATAALRNTRRTSTSTSSLRITSAMTESLQPLTSRKFAHDDCMRRRYTEPSSGVTA